MKQSKNNIPLCIDLDGTLIAGDMLFESFLKAVKNHFWIMFIVPFWLLKGRHILKRNLLEYCEIDYSLLPYRQDILDFAVEQKKQGRNVVLVTASSNQVAKGVSEHLGFFDEYYGSDNKVNLKSEAKREFLVSKFGEKGYDYIGDSSADVAVWKSANQALVVSSNDGKDYPEINFTKIFTKKSASLKLFIKQIRVYQWVKNLLIFLPIMMAHKIYDFAAFQNGILAFIAFSVIASSVYVTNDLLDLDADRQHPRKRNRPFAKGDLPLSFGIILAPLLFVLGIIVALFVDNIQFLYVLIAYYIITTAYSFSLKRIAIVDLVILATLYTIRIIAGGVSENVEISPWLLAFSMFIFISLAVLKRYTELLSMIKENRTKASGRGYHTGDANLLLSMGPASGYLAVVVFALYINSDQVVSLYSKPIVLWMIAPLLIYWISRLWLLANRGEMTDDPIVFAGKDKASYIVFGLIFLIAIAAVSL